MGGTRSATLPDCRPLLADPDDLTLAFQPIVDLAGATVAGYEALARFPGTSGPDAWFAAAHEMGLGAELEALAIHKALAAVPACPPTPSSPSTSARTCSAPGRCRTPSRSGRT